MKFRRGATLCTPGPASYGWRQVEQQDERTDRMAGHHVIPPGATDCHTHVFLDPVRFPMSPARRYTPPPAPLEALQAWHRALGIERVVIVQPSVYGTDNRATLDALRRLGPRRARGVAVIDEATSDAELRDLAAAGVCCVHVNLEIDAERDRRRAQDALRRVVDRVAPLGWHIQVYADVALIGACHAVLEQVPVPLVFDHFAGARAGAGLHQQGMAEVADLVRRGKAYVKLSAPYRQSERDDYEDLESLTRFLVACHPQRMLWGSDWPHPRPGVHAAGQLSPPYEVDLDHVVNALCRWVADPAVVRQILVDNPGRLYGFDP
jgi:predicted TIM-barrel fold metal-dependent hydrolase